MYYWWSGKVKGLMMSMRVFVWAWCLRMSGCECWYGSGWDVIGQVLKSVTWCDEGGWFGGILLGKEVKVVLTGVFLGKWVARVMVT